MFNVKELFRLPDACQRFSIVVDLSLDYRQGRIIHCAGCTMGGGPRL